MLSGTRPSAPTPEATEQRLAVLRAELQGCSQPSDAAAIHFEIGLLLERALANNSAAVREYLAAYNLDTSFSAPLLALIKIFERRGSGKNLERLYGALASASQTNEDRASALVDHAAFLQHTLGQPDHTRRYLSRALETDPNSLIASLMLERCSVAGGSESEAARATDVRSRALREPVMKALLLIEVAEARTRRGNTEGALEALHQACSLGVERHRTLEALERFARRQGLHSEHVAALEARGALLAELAETVVGAHVEGAVELEPAREAAALFREAAGIRVEQFKDLSGAEQGIERALEMLPDDELLLHERVSIAEAAHDLDQMEQLARRLSERGLPAANSAAIQLRIARLAHEEEDLQRRSAALATATKLLPTSSSLRGMWEGVLIESRQDQERVQLYETAAKTGSPEGRAHLLWRAAQTAADCINDSSQAMRLYESAAAADPSNVSLQRDLYSQALLNEDHDLQRQALSNLLALKLDAEEQTVLLRSAHRLARQHGGDASRSRALISQALQDVTGNPWAPHAGRLWAAMDGDRELLAKAHEHLAAFAEDNATAAAHFCASARAHGVNRRQDVERTLKAALDRVPTEPYALALLEEVLLAAGETDEAVALLRRAAAAAQEADDGEHVLLLAGAAAEAAGDLRLAARTYQEAAERNRHRIEPWLCLQRLAAKSARSDLARTAIEGLAALELASGEPGYATLEAGELSALGDRKMGEAESALVAALHSSSLGGLAALQLILLPAHQTTHASRAAALERLSAEWPEAATVWKEEHLSQTLAQDQPKGRLMAQIFLQDDANDPFALYASWRTQVGNTDNERLAAWLALGRASNDGEVAAEILLQGMRALTVAEGSEATDDAFMLADEIAEYAPESLVAAIALDETVEAGDDPETRLESQRARLKHDGQDLDLQATYGRTLDIAGHHEEAQEVLLECVGRDPSDFASWDALRVAARANDAWSTVVEACDHLASALTGSHRAQLLEESGAVLMDRLDDIDQAEQRFRSAFESDPSRSIAYGRLHDLLAKRGQTDALRQLVARKVEHSENDDQRAALLYEQARLRRSDGERQEALRSLDALFAIEPKHVGGLALAAEVHASLKQWEPAVDSMRKLAKAEVPDKQKRLAHVGAANFLARHLNDRRAALKELEEVERLGLLDTELYERMTDLALELGEPRSAAEILSRAVQRASQPDQARLEHRLGTIHRDDLRDDLAATAAFRRALVAVPDAMDAANAVAELLGTGPQLVSHGRAFERALRRSLEPTDPDRLRKLARSASWSEDHVLERSTLEALQILDSLNEEETHRLRSFGHTKLTEPTRPLSDEALAGLLSPADRGPAAQIARMAQEALSQLLQLDPSTFHANRSHLAKEPGHEELREAIRRCEQLFGMSAGDIYVLPAAEPSVVAMPAKRERAAWVIGSALRVPLDSLSRFNIAQLCMAHRCSTLPIVQQPPERAAKLIAAVIKACEPTSSLGTDPETAELSRAVARILSRRVKREVPELFTQLHGGIASIEDWCRAAHLTSLRAGLLLSGNLRSALEHVLQGKPDVQSIQASELAQDLLAFWLSPFCVGLRQRMGIA